MTMMTSLVVLALFATVASFAWGIISMAHGGTYDADHSAKLMRGRVVFQGIAILLLLAALFA